MAIPTSLEFWTFNDTLVGINGNALASPDGLFHFVAGNIGNAWDVQGVAAQVPILTTSPINPGDSDWTASLWLYYNGGGSQGNVLRLTDSTTTRLRLFWSGVQGDPPTVQVFFSATRVFNSEDLDPFAALGESPQWMHLCVRHTAGDPATIDVILNGEKRTATTVVNLASWSSPRIQIGGGTSPAWSDAIDAVGWWASALTDEHVSELYNAGAGWEPPPDNTPDTFDFTDVVDADLSTAYISDAKAITGINAPTAISIVGGEYRINAKSWQSDPDTLDPISEPELTLELRVTSSGSPETATTATVTVGTLSVDWTVTTGVVTSVVTNIIGGSPTTSRIFRSRIVQGMI